jgi:hypothetical protein
MMSPLTLPPPKWYTRYEKPFKAGSRNVDYDLLKTGLRISTVAYPDLKRRINDALVDASVEPKDSDMRNK